MECLGGEEFGVFLPSASRKQAVVIAERLSHAIVVEVEGLKEPLHVTLSADVALSKGRLLLDRLMSSG